MNRRTLLLGLSLAVMVAIAGPATEGAAQEHAYTGNKKCRACHLKQFNSWAETKMAKSFEHLKPGVSAEAKKSAGLDPDRDYTADSECLGCHTTGYGKEGGFVDVATTPDHLGVGCEMCHGPGGSYTASDKMGFKNKEYKRADLVAVGLVHPVGEAQCVVCHNEKNPFFKEFDFETRKREGIHEHFPLQFKHD